MGRHGLPVSIFPVLRSARMGRFRHARFIVVTMSPAPSRIRGVLRTSERGFLFEADDGHVWRVEGAEPYADLADRPVVVEAYRRTPTLLELLWAGEDQQP